MEQHKNAISRGNQSLDAIDLQWREDTNKHKAHFEMTFTGAYADSIVVFFLCFLSVAFHFSFLSSSINFVSLLVVGYDKPEKYCAL